MKVMILGAGGPIGQRLAEILNIGGHSVLNVSRRGKTALGSWLVGDRSEPEAILKLLHDHKVDALIDMIGRDPVQSEAFLDAVDGKLGRYVFISSADVYRNHGLIHQTETGLPDAGPLTEEAPLRSVLYPYRQAEPRAAKDPQKWMDTYDKVPIEAKVQASKLDWTICRLPMVYGGAVPSVRRFDWITSLMKSGLKQAELPAIWLDWKTTYGYLDNVVGAIITALLPRKAIEQVFNITDHEPMTHLEWLVAFGRVHNWTCEIIPTDASDHPIAEFIADLDLSVPLEVSGEKHRNMLGFEPTLDLEECISQVR